MLKQHQIMVSFAAGLMLASLIMYIAWAHNPQCEIHCNGVINWGHWLSIGLSWLIPTSLLTWLTIWLLSNAKRT